MATRPIKQEQRRQIDTARKRAHTYFQIGWSWLKKTGPVRTPDPFPTPTNPLTKCVNPSEMTSN